MLRKFVVITTHVLGFVAASAVAEQRPCSGNDPSTRSQWCQHSIDTDYSRVVPDTGATREYWFELQDVDIALDGVMRPAMAVNGSIPGPTIFADWGDRVVVHVKNSLRTSNNGSSIHFHGVRQNWTNQHDGVVSLTQCPTAVGETETYVWRATQYGSSWYHSHFGLQAWEGVFGGIVINGPATANYDEDLGPLFLNDWDHETADATATAHKSHFLPPLQANGLINGTNVYGRKGHRLNIRFEAGKSYRMRVVNAALETHFKFMIDDHTMTVIAADFVPVRPFTTKILDITMGQRYDIIVTADQGKKARSFWMRAIPQFICTYFNENMDNIRAIVHYGDKPKKPRSKPYLAPPSCKDETSKLVPHVRENVRDPDRTDFETATIVKQQDGFFHWTLNTTSMNVDWSNPTLSKILRHDQMFPRQDAVIELPRANTMFYMVIKNPLPNPHPIHLHGHDFYVLAQGSGFYMPKHVKLNKENPPRRDTVLLPGTGYVVIAFETNNPGVWLMHCHIGYHVEEGFSLQIVERAREIPSIIDRNTLESGCRTWSSFQREHNIQREGSGV
ncbi:hypothetical protein HIM_04170 [Hirsutella minnesotensis 3608]|uniref:Laccase-2 n=1 Tax=Hirsutella minnesotensis 3608 TaxID=1043627 RepID=A0A0F7ZLH9_9HYPO|nr:hypothetical protein HIM_04170 [Hirsutella minnesotensis 3608]